MDTKVYHAEDAGGTMLDLSFVYKKNFKDTSRIQPSLIKYLASRKSILFKYHETCCTLAFKFFCYPS